MFLKPLTYIHIAFLLYFIITNHAVLAEDDFTIDDCSKDTQEGDSCDMMYFVSSWYDGTCQLRSYGGCNPTKNNFETEEQCLQVAEPVCRDIKEGYFSKIRKIVTGIFTGLRAAEMEKSPAALRSHWGKSHGRSHSNSKNKHHRSRHDHSHR